MKIDALGLLERWQQGQLDDAGVATLRKLLEDPQTAAALAADIRHVHALREVLHQQRARVRLPIAWWRRPVVWAATAAVLLVGLALWSWWPTPPAWRVTDGEFTLARQQQEVPGRAGLTLRPGDELRTQGRTTLVSGDGSRVVLGADSHLRAVALGDAPRWELVGGSVTCAVTMRPEPRGFRVSTGVAEISVAGTAFTVTATDGLTQVTVDNGRVAVQRPSDGAAITLSAGQRTSVRPTGELVDESAALPGPAWSDRRPIALVRMWVASDLRGNPRSFGHVPPDTDLTTAAGRAVYPQALAAAGAALGRRLVAAGYQGAVVWDIEGKQHNDIMFVGDPRRLGALAPEMDLAADGFFAALRQAGLATGVMLRSERLERDATTPAGWRQVAVADPAAELIDKAQWARQRWDCSLFFVNQVASGMRSGQDELLPIGTIPALARALEADRGRALIIIDRWQLEDWGVAAIWTTLMTTGMTPLDDGLLARHPRLMRITYWPADSTPPSVPFAHDVLMRESDHVTAP